MRKLFAILALALPVCAQATTPVQPAAVPAPTSAEAMDMLTQLPAFLTRLDALRGTALSVTEKATVTDVLTQGSNTANGIQGKFLGGVSRATGLDTATLGSIIPSATKPVANTELTSRIESRLGKKMGFLQRGGVKAANTLRNNSLAGLKTSLTDGVARQVGMDPGLISAMLPMLGF